MGTPDGIDTAIAGVRKPRALPSTTALLAIVPMLAWYAYTGQRDVQFWDVGEMQTVPWIFGITHPTGFPLYTILGWAFSHALNVGPVAWRLSLFSSLAMCAAGWFAYRIVAEETGFAWLGVAASFAFDATSIAWSRGTRADVHPLCAAFEAATVYALLRWRRTDDDRCYVAALACLGAALAVHPVALFVLPAAIAFAVPVFPRLRLTTLAVGLAGFLAPLLAYATIPLRSTVLFAERRDPTLAIGMPPGRPFWDYAHTEVWANFVWFVSGAQFHREAGATGYTDAHVFAQSIALGWAVVHRDFGIPLLLLAAFGFVVLALRNPGAGLAFALLAVSVVPFTFAYAEEADKERYMLVPLFAIAVLAGIGAAGIVASIAARARSASSLAVAVLALATIGISAWHVEKHEGVIETNRDTLARRYVAQVQALVPDGAIVIADWTYATPLAYAAYVERSLGDRIVVAGTVEDMAHYIPGWEQTRCVTYVSNAELPSPRSQSFGAVRLNASLPYLFSLGSCAGGKHP